MIELMDRDDFEAQASKETLPVPLPVAGVAQSSSPLASLITFLSTLVVHGEARVGRLSVTTQCGWLRLERIEITRCRQRYPGSLNNKPAFINEHLHVDNHVWAC